MTQVFICNRGAAKTVKVQLEISPEALDRFKGQAAPAGFTAKELMQWVLNNHRFDKQTSKDE
jgi:hypothetical protein